MTDQTADDADIDRLEELLRQAHETLLDAEDDAEAAAALEDTAAAVDSIVDANETTDVVDAAGVDLPDDAEAPTIVNAIRHGDATSVAKLRTVLLLSKLGSEGSDEAPESVVDDLASVTAEFPGVDAGAPEAEAGDAVDADDGAESDAEGGRDEASGESQAEERGESRDESDEEDIAPELSQALDDFRDNVTALRDRIQDDQEAQAETEDDGEEAQGDEVQDPGTNGRPRFSGRLSTVAGTRPDGPPSTTQFSTVPGKSNED